MALLFPPGFRILDANGNPLSGAKVRVYTANTTTLVSLFSDSGLSSAISNPVITDAAGYPANGGNECAVQCAAGTYDVALLDSSDNVLASWDDVVPWGSESGDIERTVTGNGRFKVTGSAGAVLIQVGDPSPDNTGGTVTLEGWAGTQADTITLDGAIVNATGRLKENGRKISAIVQTEITPFTTAATVDIPLTNTPTGVRRWRVTIFDLVMSTSAQPALRLSYSSSLKSGGSDYGYLVAYRLAADGTDTHGKSAATSNIVVDGESWIAVTDRPCRIVIDIITPNSGNAATSVTWTAYGWKTIGGTNYPVICHGHGHGLGNYGRADSLRFYPSAGTVTGAYTVEAVPGTGD